jgi:uncharacterized phage-associated protein
MANAYDVAQLMLFAAGDESDMTNLKLNKLLYLAQGTHLARTGHVLFDEDIEAWTYGPVVPSVYQRYKVCGKNVIAVESADVDAQECVSDDESDTILDVMREYGKYSGGYLVSKTHKEGAPWSLTEKGQVISAEDIKSYFQKYDEAPRFRLDWQNLEFEGHRNADGILVLPADGDETDDWEQTK